MSEPIEKRTFFSRRSTVISKILGRTALAAAMLFAWGFASGDRLPASIKMSALAATTRAQKAKTPQEQAASLTAMRIFSRVMLMMKEKYVDPERIDPWKMLTSALHSIERQMAEVLVEVSDEDKTFSITVGKNKKTFSAGNVDNLWSMSFELKKVFDYLAASLPFDGKNDARDIEYAAVNGMLSTLDPHSIMLKEEYFKELSLQSRGEFGGLGFILQMREGELTIIRVMKDTPAQKSGLKSKDVIIKINGESMVNADLNEAVNIIRGKPGTNVKLTIKRTGWKSPKEIELTRAIIKVDSVQSKLLSNDIGYIRLKGFQGNTAADMQTSLKALRASASNGLRGLVLDLRGNPGGILDQAGLIADMFLSKGDIVTTVGYSENLRENLSAEPGDKEESLPVIVLMNSASASASEIVAGALKNNDRAMVIGRQSFGKGSVQVLYDKFGDNGALKMTIAQYLTPGGISIQEVGITPDIELVPGRISAERLDFFAPEKKTSEADLEQHLGNPDADSVAAKHEDVVRKEKPLETFLYLREAPRPINIKRRPQSSRSKTKSEKEADAEEDLAFQDMAEYEGINPDTDEIIEDFPIRFARQIIDAAPVLSRSEMLQKTEELRRKLQQEEQERVKKAIDSLGVDWSGRPEEASEPAENSSDSAVSDHLKVSISPEGPFTAGETAMLKVTVQNNGSKPYFRLKAYSECTNALLDGREFVFGRLDPGTKREWTAKIRVPKDSTSRREPFILHFSADGFEKLFDFTGEASIAEIAHPAFAFSWNLVDDCRNCNMDGVLQRGEKVAMDIDVQNIGAGKSYETIVSIRNKDFEEGLSLIKARKRLGEIAPGGAKRVRFEFELKPSFDKNEAVIQIVLSDEVTNEWVVEQARFPVTDDAAGTASQAASREKLTLKAKTAVPVLAAARKDAPVMAELPAETAVPSVETVGDFQRIQFMANNSLSVGFVHAADSANIQKTPLKNPRNAVPPKLSLRMMRQTPAIHLKDNAKIQAGIITEEDKIQLQGTASGESGIRDFYIYVNSQKVFFKSAEGGQNSIDFDAQVPLKDGKNVIHLVARQTRDVQNYKMLIVTKLPKKDAKVKSSTEASKSSAAPAEETGH